MQIPLPTRRATRRLGRALAGVLSKGDILWLEGDLGAGKTFFARGLFRALGLDERIPVTSPTFALVHEHEGQLPIWHLDLYRLAEGDELWELGLAEALPHVLMVIEWGKVFRPTIGHRGVELTLSDGPEGGRLADLRALDARGETLLRDLEPLMQAMGLSFREG